MRVVACAVAACFALHLVVPGPVHGVRRERGIVWLWLVDDLHIDFRNTGVVRAWLGSLAKQLIREEDAFAVRTTGPSSLSVGLLAGMGDLQEGIRRISGNSVRFETLVPEALGELAYRAKVSMKAARELLSIAPEHDPRRRIMLYMGKGFDAVDDAIDEMDGFWKEAWRLDVRVIAIDVGDVRAAQQPLAAPASAASARIQKVRRDSLEQLALPTHGFVLAGETPLREAAARISNAVR